MDAATRDYATRVVLATREPARYGVPAIEGQLEYGASPRATLGLVRAARALALIRGRRWATPQDVYDVAYDVLNLRLVLSYAALADGVTIDDVLVRLLRTVPAPGSPASWRGMVPGESVAATPVRVTPDAITAPVHVGPQASPASTPGDVTAAPVAPPLWRPDDASLPESAAGRSPVAP